MNFTRYCCQVLIAVGSVLFLIALFSGGMEMINGSRSSLTWGIEVITQTGVLLGIGLIALAVSKKAS